MALASGSYDADSASRRTNCHTGPACIRRISATSNAAAATAGSHAIRATAYDAAGNASSASINVTVPEKVASFDTRGSTVVFEIVVDDYAEIWVNGKAPFVLGQNGGSVAAGWNAPNRVVLTKNAQPGQKIQIAVFGINGPVSTHPDTYIWVRSATLDFYRPGKLSNAQEAKLAVDRKNPALDNIVPPSAKLEKLADGSTNVGSDSGAPFGLSLNSIPAMGPFRPVSGKLPQTSAEAQKL